MRRSAAPSQQDLFVKRQKLESENPRSEHNSISTRTKITEFPPLSNFVNEDNKESFDKENVVRTQENKDTTISKKPKFFAPRFKTPVLKNSPAKQHETKAEQDIAESNTRYYNVMWGKITKKKHKTWDADGILVTKERTAILRDIDGGIIATGRGYKAEELSKFSEAQSLCVGGKLVQIISEVSKENYQSGHCFQETSDRQNTNTIAKISGVTKPFLNPRKPDNNTPPLLSSSKMVVMPRHDPKAPDALVLPHPSSAHQWQHNKKELTVVDVVVDPYIANVLRPHQREGVTFLYECVMGMRSFAGNGAILADDMGLGKTLQCISLVWTVFKQGMYGGQPSVKRVLIITPGSLVKNWAAEFRKWLGNERMSVFTVNSENKVKEFIYSPVYPVMVISYEMFVRYVEDIKKIKFSLVVCDEAHRLKNSAIKTSMHITSLDIKRKILLTGTPIQNDLTEFYSLSEFCNPGIFGTQASFRRLFEEPIVRGRQPDATEEEKELGVSRANELNRLTSQFLLRRNSDINNKYLPKKMESVVFCRGSDLQFHLYKHLISSRWFRSCFLSTYSGSSHLICIAALKKLCNHPTLLFQTDQNGEIGIMDGENLTLYDDIQQYFPANYEANLPEHSGKLKVLSDMLYYIKTSLPNERVVIVSNYTQTLDIIQKLCEARSYQSLRLDGQTATNQRQNLVERFNRKLSQDFVFLLSSKAGGVGLNLTGASILILFDIDWNPANDIQAMARVWRDGQKKKVKIYRLLTTGTIEEKIYQRQITKQGLSCTVADNATISSKNEFSREDLKDLFTLNTKTTCLTHELLNCSCAKHNSEVESNSIEFSTTNTSTLRSCQLGNRQPKESKNLSMAELMQWAHYSRPIKETQLTDDVLGSCSENIDFVFQTETS